MAEAAAALPAARLTNYIFAHSKYSSVLGQSNVLSGLLADADEQGPAAKVRAVDGAAVSHAAMERAGTGCAHRAMMTSLRNRAGWLLPCAAVGALALALPQRSLSADDARDWLEKMNHALATRNYDGTFFHLSEGRVETMRIVHRVKGGRVTERLLSLDGSGREFVRNNDELTCYLPDQRTVLVEPRQDRAPFLGSLPQFGADVNEFYRIESLPASRVLGRAARVIAVNPKDQFRFGYRLWLDENTAMPLKTQLCDARGQVIEQILFARLEMPESIPDSELDARGAYRGHALGAAGSLARYGAAGAHRPIARANCRPAFV